MATCDGNFWKVPGQSREHFIINRLRLEQDGWYFADSILKYIFLHENNCILIQISQESNCQQVIIGSGNGLVPVRHQAITWTNVDSRNGLVHRSHNWIVIFIALTYLNVILPKPK